MASRVLIDAAATPPLQGGEYASTELCLLVKNYLGHHTSVVQQIFSMSRQSSVGAHAPPLRGGECACAGSVTSKPEIFHETGHPLVPGGRPVPLQITAK